MRVVQFLFLAFFMLTGLNPAKASGPATRVVDLQYAYGPVGDLGMHTVGEVCGSEAAMAARFPAWSAHWAGMGHAMADMMDMSYFSCAWNDAVLAGAEVPGGSTVIQLPAGEFRVDQTLYVLDGVFRGAPGGATRLVMDTEVWQGRPTLMQVLALPMRSGRMEISDLVLVGPGKQTLPEACGVWIDWPGASCTMERITAEGFGGTAINIIGASATGLRDLVFRDNGTAVRLDLAVGGDHTVERVNGSSNATWFGARAGGLEEFDWHIAAVGPDANGRAESGRLLQLEGLARVDLNQVTFAAAGSAAWIEVSAAREGSRVSGTGMRVRGEGRPWLSDLDRGMLYGASSGDEGGFSFCWVPGSPEGRLPETCGNGPDGAVYKAGGGSISIGAVNGPVLTDLEWGYNSSGLFYSCAASDTSLQNRLNELQPHILRFPGGTLANFYHPGGLGYGIRQQDVNLVAGFTVHNNINGNFQDEQALIAAGEVTRNYIHEMIALAQATGCKILYVANLLTGTVGETVAALNAFANAGVEVVGVELGNEAHLSAYDFRFGSVANYLAVAQPYATAIQNNFPGLRIGLNGYPPGILKDMGPAGTQRALDWNTACSEAAFGDALIIHCYSRPGNCNQSDVHANFLCGADFSQVYANEKLPVALAELSSLGSKMIWITEWNIDGGYNHYGNSMAQALFYGDMAITMAQAPKVSMSAYHELLAYGDGYNLVKKKWSMIIPQVNYWTSELFADLYVPGNQPQSVTITGINGLRGYAFLAADGMQHLYLVNRSGSPMDLSSFAGSASNVSWTVIGSSNIVEGTGPNAAMAQGNVTAVSGVAASIVSVQLPAYAIAHLKWIPVTNGPLWSTTFSGTQGCTLTAMTGSSVSQPITQRCANISGGQVVTHAKTSFPMQVTTSKVLLLGVTFSNVGVGRWINSRLRFQGQPGRICDVVTGQVMATVSAGVRYEQLTLDFGGAVPVESLIGRPNIGNKTALMTIEGMKLFP